VPIRDKKQVSKSLQRLSDPLGKIKKQIQSISPKIKFGGYGHSDSLITMSPFPPHHPIRHQFGILK